jgi:uncharacterized RDD family membrane protein YckC
MAGGGNGHRGAWDELTTSLWSDDPALYDGVMLRRVVAYLIDVGILFISSWFVMILLGVLSLGIAFFFIAGIFTVLALAYHTFFIARNAATPGMSLLDLQVTTLESQPPDFGQALVTTVLFYLSVLVTVWIVLIVPLLNAKHRTLHDFIAGTLVVRRSNFVAARGT